MSIRRVRLVHCFYHDVWCCDPGLILSIPTQPQNKAPRATLRLLLSVPYLDKDAFFSCEWNKALCTIKERIVNRQ